MKRIEKKKGQKIKYHKKKEKQNRMDWREARAGILFLLPSFIGVSIFVLIPFADVVRRSFLEAMTPTFVGWKNYETVFSNEMFQLAVGNTLKFLAVCIPLLLTFSLILALLIQTQSQYAAKLAEKRKRIEAKENNQIEKKEEKEEKDIAGDFYKTSYLIPMAIPIASVALLWKLFFQENGLLNGLMKQLFGIQVSFMNSNAAFLVLIFSYLWKNIGYDMVLWQAGLNGISPNLYEAAGVDGAGMWAKFWHITLPDLKPTLFTVLVLSLVNSFKVFREAYLVAGSYPHQSIYLLQHLFNNWFVSLDIQKMSAGAVIIAIVILLIIGAFQLLSGKEK